MSAFAAAIAAIMRDPNQSREVLWWPFGLGPVQSVRAVIFGPDDTIDYGETTIQSDTLRMDVRIADMPEPRAGDRITVDAAEYVIDGLPRKDSVQLTWRVLLVPLDRD